MKTKETLLSRSLLLGVATGVSKAAVFLLMPLYTAYLTPAAFGAADIIAGTAVLLLPFVSFNAPEAVFRFRAGGDREKQVFSCGVLMLTGGMVVLLLLMPFTALLPVLETYRIYLFFYVLASVARSFLAHWVRAEGNYTLYAVQQVFCTFSTVALLVLFLPVLRLGTGGYLAATVTADALTAAILLLYLRPWRYFAFTAVKKEPLFAMLRYALPLMPTTVLWWVTSVSDRYIILHYHGENVMGLYAAAGRIPSVLTFGVAAFLEVWHYTAVRAGEGERSRLFDRVYALLLPVLTAVSAFLVLFARSITGLLFAADYADAARYVPILTVGSLFSALSAYLGSIYTVRLNSVASLLTALFGAALNVLLNLWWIPRGGAMAAALATAVSYLAMFLLRVFHSRRGMAFDPRLLKLTAAAALLSLTAFLSLRGPDPVLLLLGAAALAPFAAEIRTGLAVLFDMAARFFRRQKGVDRGQNRFFGTK